MLVSLMCPDAFTLLAASERIVNETQLPYNVI